MNLGKIKFYDADKKNLGYIIIETKDKTVEKEIYFHGNSVLDNRFKLTEGKLVIFNITKKGKRQALNIKLYDSLSNEEKIDLIPDLPIMRLRILTYELLADTFNFTENQKKNILNELKYNDSPDEKTSLKIIDKLRLEDDEKNIIDLIGTLNDQTKLYILENNENLIDEILQSWCFDDNYLTVRLFNKFSKSIDMYKIPEKFKERLTEIVPLTTFETVSHYVSVFKDTAVLKTYIENLELIKDKSFFDLCDLIKKHFPAQKQNSFFRSRLRELLPNTTVENLSTYLSFFNDITALKSYLKTLKEIDENTFGKIRETVIKYFPEKKQKSIFTEIYYLIKEYKIELDLSNTFSILKIIFSDDEKIYNSELSEILLHKQVSSIKEFYEILDLVEISEYPAIDKHLIKSYKKFQKDIDDSEKLSLFKRYTGKYLGKLIKSWKGYDLYSIIDLMEFINSDMKLSYKDEIASVVKKLVKPLNNEEVFTFLESSEIHEQLILYYLSYGDFDNFTIFIEKFLFFSSESFDIGIEYFNRIEIKVFLSEILAEQTNLSNKMQILRLFTDLHFVIEKDVLKSEISVAKSFLQQYLIKHIIFQYYQKIVKVRYLQSILNIDTWTDLSSIILINFIKQKPEDKKEAIRLLSSTFKEHLNKINKRKDLHDTFINLHLIRKIVKHCDGRKHYEKKKWKRDNKTRYYTDKKELNISHVEDYYCEGRYWKKDQLWDSKTNEPFEVSLFWCRGGVCNQPNSKCNFELNSNDWTLKEIAEIFNFKLDQIVLSNIAGWANRINEIIEQLRCRKCDSILRPIPFDPKSLGYYATPKFNCINKKCKLLGMKIRFSHCLNSKCERLLDSRDLETCSKGWMICECGTCCPTHTGRDFEYKPVQY
jgi:hypothetical protein